jgi:hypothetical protein
MRQGAVAIDTFEELSGLCFDQAELTGQLCH